MKTEAPL